MSDSLKYKRILVTGSSAVLGTAVRSISVEYPENEFIFPSSSECNLTDASATLRFFELHEPEAVLHLAAVSGGIGLSIKHPATLLRDNIIMTFSVLEAARKCRVKKTIMTLTAGMYPTNAPLPLREEYIHDGYPHESNYGLSFAKRLIDPAIRAYSEEYGMNVIGLIPGGIFGENDNFNYDDATMVPSLIRRFYENKDNNDDIVIWGDGTPLREYSYSKDLARIYIWALEHYNGIQVLNIGSTEENSVRDIAFMIADIMGIDTDRICFDTSKPLGIFRKNTDNSRLAVLSHFKYTPFKDGIEKTIRWFCNAIENQPEVVRLYNKSNRRKSTDKKG